MDPDTGFADFTGYVRLELTLPQEYWLKSDRVQFGYLERKLREMAAQDGTDFVMPDLKRYTWHHHQDPGRMQLVEFGAHATTNHYGGRNVWGGGTDFR